MTTPLRRKTAAAAAREWAVIAGDGRAYAEEIGKYGLMRRTGLLSRDLRVMDPVLSYPSSILGRERAIVVNLEHIRAVVTASEVLVLNSRDPIVAVLVHDLGLKLSASHQKDQEAQRASNLLSLHEKNLPFEFRALEICLESACKYLETETLTLEKEAYPVLDELTGNVSTLNLERVRQIKSRLVAISARVQKVRDELEHLLDDDMDMAAMHLSEKLAYQVSIGQSSRFDHLDKEIEEERIEELEEEDEEEEEKWTESLSGFRPKIDELEILLEAYFVQIDGTLNKLSALREYVEDTEDYINIMLDDKQNQLLQMGVLLSTGKLIA
ncbi:hypothetical protein LUZ60_004217 [Juncus effusus]|nr:hypothetical protein LUZ60_004217 [Juncus effusus]